MHRRGVGNDLPSPLPVVDVVSLSKEEWVYPPGVTAEAWGLWAEARSPHHGLTLGLGSGVPLLLWPVSTWWASRLMLIQSHRKDSGERVVFKSNVALIGGRNPGLWRRHCQTGRGPLGTSISWLLVCLNGWGGRDGLSRPEAVGGEGLSTAPTFELHWLLT